MKVNKIIGRDREVKRLGSILRSKKSEFVVIYGRRRVGKTFLIREYFQRNFDFEFTGLSNANTAQQLMNFHAALRRQTDMHDDQVPQNWFEAFQRLIDHLEAVRHPKKKIIFFDELPWMDSARSDFIMALEHFWNSWATNRTDILLIGCGSAASWMINKLINNHGGLHNRITERIKLQPFNLQEAEAMLQSRGNVLDRYQVLQLYMAMGGIPYYLEQVTPGKSATQNIEELCFVKGALLDREFQNLFVSLFKNAARHEKIVTALSSKTKGLSRKEIAQLAGMNTGGGLTRILGELEESGFITSYLPLNKKSRDTLYQLTDFYSSFYLKFIKANTNYDPGAWTNNIDNPVYRSWAGFAFERVCLAHVFQIKKALGIQGIISQSTSWRSSVAESGAQIDLVIDRRDQVINICEMKFSLSPYSISKPYHETLRNKIETFRSESKTKKAIFLVFVSTYGLKSNEYSSLAQNDVTMDALFE